MNPSLHPPLRLRLRLKLRRRLRLRLRVRVNISDSMISWEVIACKNHMHATVPNCNIDAINALFKKEVPDASQAYIRASTATLQPAYP